MTGPDVHALRVVEEIWIEAPPERVFRALTDPAELVDWWSVPEQYTTSEAEVELREGGEYRLAGWSRGRGHFEVRGVYEIVDPPRHLTYTWVPDWDDDARRSRVDILLEDRDGGTHVRVTHTGFLTCESRDGHAGGWPTVLALLGRYVAPR